MYSDGLAECERDEYTVCKVYGPILEHETVVPSVDRDVNVFID